MQPFPPTYILRHQRENLKKCSLRGLEQRADCHFFTYPCSEHPDISGYLLLAIDAPPLQSSDANKGLYLLDATWRYAAKMLKFVETKQTIERRSIPGGFRTAYPRCQNDCPNPDKGLASIEALYISYLVLGRNPTGLLDNYYWKDLFLEKNQDVFSNIFHSHYLS